MTPRGFGMRCVRCGGRDEYPTAKRVQSCSTCGFPDRPPTEHERVCLGPGCDVLMEGRDPEARFCTPRCRARDWKARTGYGRQSAVRTPRRANASGPSIRISYLRALDATADALIDAGVPRARAREHARTALRPLLTQRQAPIADRQEARRDR